MIWSHDINKCNRGKYSCNNNRVIWYEKSTGPIHRSSTQQAFLLYHMIHIHHYSLSHSLSLPPPITISLPNMNLNTNKPISSSYSVLQHICRSHDRLAEICHVERVVEEGATLGLKEAGCWWARRPKDTISGVQEIGDLVQRL